MATKVGFQLESSLASKHLTDAEFIKGSFIVVSTIAARDSLPVATDTTDGVIVKGSLCYCTADSKFYQYNGTSWSVKEFGATAEATSSAAGLMSASDKSNLDTIVNSFNSDDSNTTIDTVKEVLKAFENAPEGTNIANALAAKSNVGHNHEVTTAAVLTGVKPSGTDTFIKTISGGGGSLTSNTTATDGIKYIDSVTHSAASLTGTKTFNTDAIKDITLSASTTNTDGPAYVESVTHTAATLGGTKTFNTDAIKSVTLSASTTNTDGPKYVESISGSAPSLTGDKTFVKTQGTFSAGTTPVSSAAPTHTSTKSGSSSGTTGTIASYSAGVLTINTTVDSGSHTHTYDKATGITLTRGTAPSLGNATTGTVGISGGSYSATTKYMKPTGTAASTGTVSISGGSINPVTKYMKKTNTAASTGTVGISGGSITPSTKYLHHTHTAASTATTGSAVTGVTSNGTANAVTAITDAEN